MRNAKKIDTNGRRELVYGRLRGINPDGTTGEKVSNYSTKIQKVLHEWNIDVSKKYIIRSLWGDDCYNPDVLEAAEVVLARHEQEIQDRRRKKQEMLQSV
ncbi:hypothetical protein [Larkinella soli]|uniref:hypothetical protein n=1 Tax=Larkinella soli TaxID=1770527 RepID=UPI000FFCBE0F|nr:hypothetical protein [Larkinella soli]